MPHGTKVLRIRGTLKLEAQDRPVAIRGAQHLFHPPVGVPAFPVRDDHRSLLVVVARDLDRTWDEGGLRAFAAGAAGPAVR